METDPATDSAVEPTIELTLKLQLPVKTIKKLKAFAMLSGMTINELEENLLDEIQPELARHFDQTLSHGIAQKLSELDGTQVRILTEGEEAQVIDSEHSLSADDDNDENLSLEEQVEKDKALQNTLPKTKAEASQKVALLPQNKKASRPSSKMVSENQEEFKFEIDVPDAENTDQYIDSMFETTASQPRSQVQSGPYGAMTAAGTFNPNKPRVKISEHTANESDFFS